MKTLDDRGHPPPFYTEEGAHEKWLEKIKELFKKKKENQREKAS